jgi:hypothetical protein
MKLDARHDPTQGFLRTASAYRAPSVPVWMCGASAGSSLIFLHEALWAKRVFANPLGVRYFFSTCMPPSLLWTLFGERRMRVWSANGSNAWRLCVRTTLSKRDIREFSGVQEIKLYTTFERDLQDSL